MCRSPLVEDLRLLIMVFGIDDHGRQASEILRRTFRARGTTLCVSGGSGTLGTNIGDTFTASVKGHHDVVLVSLNIGVSLAGPLPPLHSDPLSGKLELIQCLFRTLPVLVLRQFGEIEFRFGYESVQLFLLAFEFAEPLTLFFPPEQHADEVLLSIEVQQGQLVGEPRANLEGVDGPVFPDHLVLPELCIDPFAHALGVDDAGHVKRSLVESVGVGGCDLVHVAHVPAIAGQVDRGGGSDIGEEVGNSSIGKSGEGKPQRAVSLAIHLTEGTRMNTPHKETIVMDPAS